MWSLDPAGNADLTARLRPHARANSSEPVWAGPGWRSLIAECHDRVAAAFPEYELLAIKQKYGALSFQAFPRRWVKGESRWTADEAGELHAITEEFGTRSETICEWCGAPARLRDWRTLELTLCDPCDHRFPDPPDDH